jgi:hypothetical protein
MQSAGGGPPDGLARLHACHGSSFSGSAPSGTRACILPRRRNARSSSRVRQGYEGRWRRSCRRTMPGADTMPVRRQARSGLAEPEALRWARCRGSRGGGAARRAAGFRTPGTRPPLRPVRTRVDWRAIRATSARHTDAADSSQCCSLACAAASLMSGTRARIAHMTNQPRTFGISTRFDF